MLDDELDVRFGKDAQIRARDAEPRGAQLDLPGRFLARNVQDPVILPEIFADLQQDRRFADARIAADQDQRALDQPAAEHAVELGKARVVPLLVIGIDLLNRQWSG